jgi:uncharacterized protein YjbI with pentapeptide repeats
MGRREELARILDQHQRWLESERRQGARADLSGAELDGVELAGVDLSGAVLRGVLLREANLSQARLIHADLRDASLQDANLAGANLMLTDFSGSDMLGANLSGAIASSDLGQTRRGPRFRDVDLRNARLVGAYCSMSDFSGANLAGAQMAGVILELAKLAETDLSQLDLSGANLCNADLRRCNLSGANLREARLIHANLEEATLSRADVSGAALQSANLANAKVDGIRYDRKARFQGVRVDSCYGSSRFKRHARDQDYIEEFKAAHPYYYILWRGLTDCGRSMTRVILWSAVLAVFFGLVFFSLGREAFALSHPETLPWGLFSMIYYSVVTFTTLGFGDITPRTPLAATLVMVEVVTGYLMLGILISILATKVARRS